jgi:sugar transferase (PEP-CTERM/EpsH1 system associated)
VAHTISSWQKKQAQQLTDIPSACTLEQGAMKVMVVSSEIPYPPTHGGARLRLFELLKRLSVRHELTLFTLIDSPNERQYAEGIRPWCHHINMFPRPDYSKPGRVRDYLQAHFWRMCYSPAFSAAIQKELATQKYDLVHVDTGHMAMYRKAINGVPSLLAATDCLTSGQWTAIQSNTGIRSKIRDLWRTVLVLNYERTQYSRYNRCVLIAKPDADMVHRLCPDLPISIVPNGVDAEYFVPAPGREASNRVVFTGTMDFSPNVDAVVHFAKRIYPRIKTAVPDFQFTIVGRNPTPEVVALAEIPGVSVLGFVPDLRSEVQRATAYICPLRQGSGMKNKVLEAMAMGKAIVATRSAISGLDLKDQQEVLLADDDQSFADAVIALLSDPLRRTSLGKQARDYVLTHHGWQRMSELMSEAYEKTFATTS